MKIHFFLEGGGDRVGGGGGGRGNSGGLGGLGWM